MPNAAASQEREIPSSRLYPLSFIEYVAGLIVGSYSGFLSPPYRFRGGRIWSRPAARANRARSFRRRIEQPSRRDRARPDGGIPCTKRSSGRGRRQRCRASAAGLGAGTVGARTAPRATSVPREQVDAVEAPQRLEISPQDPRPEKLLEADNSRSRWGRPAHTLSRPNPRRLRIAGIVGSRCPPCDRLGRNVATDTAQRRLGRRGRHFCRSTIGTRWGSRLSRPRGMRPRLPRRRPTAVGSPHRALTGRHGLPGFSDNVGAR